MADAELLPTPKIDGPALRRAIREAGGPAIELVEPLPGGEVGAWLVRWPDGHLGVLTWAPPPRTGEADNPLTQIQALVEIARAVGQPAPAFEAVVDIGQLGAAVLQERAAGRVPDAPEEGLVESLLDLAERRRGVLRGTRFCDRPAPLYLTSPGPGFCLHEPLRRYSPRSARLLAVIRTIGAGGDSLVGTDLVHFDYHLGNVLVDPENPEMVTAILDWDGARAGLVALDLAILAFDLTGAGFQALRRRVEDRLQATTDRDIRPRLWAHVALRLVDWSIRHHTPERTEHWLGVAEDHLL